MPMAMRVLSLFNIVACFDDHLGDRNGKILFRLDARSSCDGVGCGVFDLSPLAKQNIRNRLRKLHASTCETRHASWFSTVARLAGQAKE